MNVAYTYLASPYTHPDPQRRAVRFQLAAFAAKRLMERGDIVFCPIAHSHPIDECFGWPQSGEFWKRQDEPFLMGCAKLVVLRLDGWEESKGLAHELAVARERGIPVEFMDP